MSPQTLIKQLTAKCQKKKGEIQMTTYQGVLHVIMGYQDKIHNTSVCDSFAEACIAVGELKLLYVNETICEIGINKITDSNGKSTVEYTTITKMNEYTEKVTRDWAKRSTPCSNQ